MMQGDDLAALRGIVSYYETMAQLRGQGVPLDWITIAANMAKTAGDLAQSAEAKISQATAEVKKK